MSIVSPVRTARIIEEVADKHGLDVTAMLCARWKRDMVLARGEVVYRLRTELGMSYRMIGGKLGLAPARVCSLLTEHKKREAQARLFVSTPDPDGRIRELEEEIKRLSGAMLCEKLAERLDLKMRLAICLAILIEAYPRFVRGPALLQLYDEARTRLGFGRASDAASHVLLNKNMSDLNADFAKRGLPAPARNGEGGGARRLTDEAAEWLAQRVGAPRWSAIETVREGRADRQEGRFLSGSRAPAIMARHG